MCCLQEESEGGGGGAGGGGGEITFYMKGADVVMHNIVQYNDWMDEEVRTDSRSMDAIWLSLRLSLLSASSVFLLFCRFCCSCVNISFPVYFQN